MAGPLREKTKEELLRESVLKTSSPKFSADILTKKAPTPNTSTNNKKSSNTKTNYNKNSRKESRKKEQQKSSSSQSTMLSSSRKFTVDTPFRRTNIPYNDIQSYAASQRKKYGTNKLLPNEYYDWNLKSADGKDFGIVSWDVMKNVYDGTLDKYIPKNMEEKKIIESFRKYKGYNLGGEIGKVSYDDYVKLKNGDLEGDFDDYDAINKIRNSVSNTLSVKSDTGEDINFGNIGYYASKYYEKYGTFEGYEVRNTEEANAIAKYTRWRKDLQSKEENPYSVMSAKELGWELKKINDDYGSGRITEDEYFKTKDTINQWRIYNADEDEIDDLVREFEEEKESYAGLYAQKKGKEKVQDEIFFEGLIPENYTSTDLEKRYEERAETVFDTVPSNIATAKDRKKELKDAKEAEEKKDVWEKKYGSNFATYTPTESGNTVYDDINKYIKGETKKSGELWEEFTDEEMYLYSRIYNESPLEADKFYEEMKPALKVRKSKRKQLEAAEFGEKHPYLAGLASVPLSIAGGISATVDNALIDPIFEGGVDTHDFTSNVVRYSQSLRQGGSQYMQKRHGQAGAWTYNTVLSIVEYATISAATKGIGSAAGLGTKAISAIASGSMAMNAASNQMINIADRGGNDAQIIIGGIAAGAAEYIFEKYSIENLLSPSSGKLVFDIFKQGGVETSEEVITACADLINDAIIMSNNSESKIRQRQLVMEGKSAKEAFKKVFYENLDQVLQSGAGGFVSGGVMVGSTATINNVMYNNKINSVARTVSGSPAALDAVIRLGNEVNNSEAKFVGELIQEGVTPDAKQVRTLVESVANDSITKDASLPGIVKVIGAIEGRNSDYYNSQEAIDTANAVLKMTNGTATKADYALIKRSEGARTIILSAEGTKAWDSLKAEADKRMRNAERIPSPPEAALSPLGKGRSAVLSEGKSATISDGEIISNGERVTIDKASKVAGNVVLDEESYNFRKANKVGYKAIQTMAKDLGMKVKYVDGLTDNEGNVLDGVITSEGIFINTQSKNPTRWAATHEFSHRMKQTGGKMWQRYQDYVISHLKETGKYEERYNLKKGAYAENEIDEEIASDYIGEMFEDVKELSNFIRRNRRDAFGIRNAYYKVLDKLGLLDEKKKAQAMWAKAYREAMKNSDAEYEGGVHESKSGTRVSENSDLKKSSDGSIVGRDGKSEKKEEKTDGKERQPQNMGDRRYDGHRENRRRNEKISIYFGQKYKEINRRFFKKSEGEQKQTIVNSGQTLATYTEISDSLYTSEMKEIAKNNKRYGMETIFTVGEVSFEHSNDRVQVVGAAFVDDIMFIDANIDSELTDVADHEFIHFAIRKIANKTEKSKLEVARDLFEKIHSLMEESHFQEKLDVITELVYDNYENATIFNVFDEFCAEIGYLVKYSESIDWFSDYDGVVSLFDDLKNSSHLRGEIKKSVAGTRVVEGTTSSTASGPPSPQGEGSGGSSEKAKYTDRFSREKLRSRIDSDFTYLHSMLKDPTDKRHIPEHLRASVAAVLDCIKFETKQLDKIRDAGKEAQSPTAIKLAGISGLYEDIMRKAWGVEKSGESKLLDEYLSEDLLELKESIPVDESGEFKRLQDMSTEELRVIGDVLRGIHHAVTKSNQAFTEGIKTTIDEASDNVVAELATTRSERKGSGQKLEYGKEKGIGKAIGAIDEFMNVEMIQPWDMFHNIGGTLEKIFGENRKAFDKHIVNLKKASDAIKAAIGDLKVKKMTGKGAKVSTFELSDGSSIEIDKGQLLSLYALYKRPQGKEHLLSGGIITGRKATNSSGNKVSGNEIHRVSETDLGEMFEALSAEEKKMVEDIVRFMSKECARWGNEASMKLYGYEKYGEGWYFPIKVADTTLQMWSGGENEGNLRTQSFTKRLVKNAGNAVVINDFFDTVTSHINGMSLYNTIALPMLDMERVLNHKTEGETVRQAINITYGKAVNRYINKWLEDVNGSKKITDDGGLTEKFFKNAKKASIGLNARVLVQQPTSITRALLFMNPADLTVAEKALIHPANTIKEMQEHVPIAYWKSLGFRDVGTGGSMKDVLIDNESLYDKVAMGGYGLADDMTWALIYTAVKTEVQRKNPDIEVGSDAYWEKVVDRFNYIVDRSQVVDSVFHRSQIMRSDNAYVQTATMFMSEPIKNLNMYRTELEDAIKTKDKKTIAKKVTRATAVYMFSNLILALVQALPDAWREDDEKELYDENGRRISFGKMYLKKVGINFLDNINPLTGIPYVKDLISILNGYSMDRVEYSSLVKTINAVKALSNDKIPLPKRMWNVFKNGAPIFGFAPGNLARDFEGITKSIMRGFGDEYVEYNLTKINWDVRNPSNKSKFMKFYDRALKNGNAEDANLILNDYLSSVYKNKDFKNKHSEAVLGEVAKLYGKTESDSKLLFDLPDSEFSFDGKKVVIPENDYDEYIDGYYDTLWNMAYEFVQSEEYNSLSDEDKVRSFGELKNYAAEAQRMDSVDGYELTGWKGEVYSGETEFIDSVIERIENREYQAERDEYKDTFTYDESKYTDEELSIMEQVESDAASYYSAVEMGREYNESDLRHIRVYDEKLSEEMTIEEYAGIRAYAKKTAAMEDGKPAMTKNELKTYLDSTNYDVAIKRALFEAIGNSNWNNPY